MPEAGFSEYVGSGFIGLDLRAASEACIAALLQSGKMGSSCLLYEWRHGVDAG